MNYIDRIVASAGLALCALAAQPATAQTQLIYNAYLKPFDETFQVGIRDFARAIGEETGGEVVVSIPDSSLAPSDRQYEMVRDGIADIALMQVESVSQFMVLNELGGLPGMAPTSEAGSVAIWETYQQFFKPLDELPGVVVLSAHTLPGRDILALGDLRIDGPGALSGKRLWATARPFIEATEELGGVPVLTEFGELQEYAARGDVDAVFISPGSGTSAGVLDMTGQIARLPGGFGSQSFIIVISQERWMELSEEQQAGVLRAAEDLPRRIGAANDASEAEVADKVAAIGVHVFDGAALEGFTQVVSPQIEAWKARAIEAGLEDPQAAIDFYLDVVARESAE